MIPLSHNKWNISPRAVSQRLWRISLNNLPPVSAPATNSPPTPVPDYYETCVLSQIRTELIEGELRMKQIKQVHANQLLLHRPPELWHVIFRDACVCALLLIWQKTLYAKDVVLLKKNRTRRTSSLHYNTSLQGISYAANLYKSTNKDAVCDQVNHGAVKSSGGSREINSYGK